MFDAVIFDMDGLMFDTERVWGSLWEPALASQGLPCLPGFVEAARGTANQQSREVIWRFYGADAPAEAVRVKLVELADEVFSREVPKKPGIDELLEFLRARGVPMAVASSTVEPIVRRNLRNAGVEGFFSHIVTGENVARSKPEPDVFLEAARRLGVDPAGTLVLEDSFAGVRAGAAGGFVTVMVPDIMQPTDEIRALASRVCVSLDEVRGLLEAGELDVVGHAAAE